MDEGRQASEKYNHKYLMDSICPITVDDFITVGYQCQSQCGDYHPMFVFKRLTPNYGVAGSIVGQDYLHIIRSINEETIRVVSF